MIDFCENRVILNGEIKKTESILMRIFDNSVRFYFTGSFAFYFKKAGRNLCCLKTE